ncbi:MAG TPA: CPBP family intramembrane glutamic endopeptidase [Acidimicrobiales bacterium]|nr:CPBP family intramembrane glutamic endopeptidase [Acidimicrobiales bacterium]
MGILAAGLASLLAAVLVLAVPLAGRQRYRRLLDAVERDPGARLRYYQRGIEREWLAVALVGVIGLLAHRGPDVIGLTTGPHPGAALEVVVEVGIFLGLSAVVFRYGGDVVRQVLRRQARGFLALLPRGPRERRWFIAVAVTAGVCEEVLLRGFGFAYVRWLWPSSPDWAVVAMTAAVFGLDHLYQGARGVILTGLVGAVLGSVVTSTGSLLPAMAVHALVDLRVLALPDLSSPDEPAPTRRPGVRIEP